MDEAIQGWSQQQQEVTVKQEGFRGNLLLVDRETGTFQIVGLWDTVDNIHATTVPAGTWEAMVQRGDLLAMPTVEIMEVAASNADPKR